MIGFKLDTWSGHEIWVEIYKTKKEFLKAFKEKYGLKGRGGRACCLYSINKEKCKEIATVAFCAKDLNVGTITHEFIHAITGAAAQNKWDFFSEKGNEEIAWNIGYLVGDCCLKLDNLGFKIKFNPDSKKYERVTQTI